MLPYSSEPRQGSSALDGGIGAGRGSWRPSGLRLSVGVGVRDVDLTLGSHRMATDIALWRGLSL